MTDLLLTIPYLPPTVYSHLLPSLERARLTTIDLITLDALTVAKRANVPAPDVRRLVECLLAALQGELGIDDQKVVEGVDVAAHHAGKEELCEGRKKGWLRKTGEELVDAPRRMISTLDPRLDEMLGGGFQAGYISEVVGESGTGKTLLLHTLLLSAQLLPPPSSPPTSPGPNQSSPPPALSSTLYISTEHPLSTLRLTHLQTTHPALLSLPRPSRPSLSHIHSIHTADLEAQSHVLTYHVPVLLRRLKSTLHPCTLIALDSVAGNFRGAASDAPGGENRGKTLALRADELLKLGACLRALCHDWGVAVVVANQVADRFERFVPAPPVPTSWVGPGRDSTPPAPKPSFPLSSAPAPTSSSLPPSPAPPTSTIPVTTTITPIGDLLSYDHQLNFFSGWTAAPPPTLLSSSQPQPQPQPHTQLHPQTYAHPQPPNQNLKTPALGLTWTNQLACRVALVRRRRRDHPLSHPSLSFSNSNANLNLNSNSEWRRWARLVFSPWAPRTTGSASGRDGMGEVEGEVGVEIEVWKGGVRAL